jgi:Raf kinase inhibitor-like YbhB/YbcL family protein
VIRSKAAAGLVVLALGLTGCSHAPPATNADGRSASAPASDDGKFAVLPGDGFPTDGSFDARMTCDGAGDYSPPLVFRGTPAGTVELVLSMVDEDKASKSGDPLIHWVEWKIPPDSTGLAEHAKPDAAREALSDLGEATYNGPCPPAGQTHHYRFTLLAVSKPLDLPYGSPARTVLAAARPVTIATATFVATYARRLGGRGSRAAVTRAGPPEQDSPARGREEHRQIS